MSSAEGVTARQLILVDGRSGAGKTQWASALARQSGFFLLSLDDIYPGWDGLDAGHWHTYHHGIVPWSEGRTARLRVWDWERARPGGIKEISPEVNLIIEGCGALSALTTPHATKRYWVDADDEVRKQRALDRDGEQFAPHWLRWALQEERFYRIHQSRGLADSVITT